jgi:hypothetical protein
MLAYFALKHLCIKTLMNGFIFLHRKRKKNASVSDKLFFIWDKLFLTEKLLNKKST